MGELPAEPAVKFTVTKVLFGVTEVNTGADGRASGVTATRGADAGPVPATLVATTET